MNGAHIIPQHLVRHWVDPQKPSLLSAHLHTIMSDKRMCLLTRLYDDYVRCIIFKNPLHTYNFSTHNKTHDLTIMGPYAVSILSQLHNLRYLMTRGHSPEHQLLTSLVLAVQERVNHSPELHLHCCHRQEEETGKAD